MAKKIGSELVKELKDALDILESPEFMKQLGEFVKKGILDRTKAGVGVDNPGGNRKPLKPLSPAYVEQRKRMKLAKDTSPGKSNLTQTGKMLKDLTVISTKAKTAVDFKNDESKTKAKHNEDNGRPFAYVDKEQIKEVEAIVQAKLEELLKK